MAIEFGDTQRSLSDTLNGMIASIRGETITLRELMTEIGEQGFLLLCALLTLPFLLPVSIPGVSTVFGAAIILISVSVTLNRLPWVPQRILDRKIETEKLVPTLQKGASLVSKLDRYVRPRLGFLTQGAVMNRFNGLMIMAGGILLMFPLGLIPLSNTLPGIAILAVTLTAAIWPSLQGILLTALALGFFIAAMILLPKVTWAPLRRQVDAPPAAPAVA